jgi:hypothetical protein
VDEIAKVVKDECPYKQMWVNSSIATKDDLYQLVDSIATNERAIKKAYELLSIVREQESDSIRPVPLRSPGISVDNFFKLLKNNRLSPENAEEMSRQVEEFDPMDNLVSGSEDNLWES